MSWLDTVSDIVRQFETGERAPDGTDIHDNFQQVARSAPRDAVADGIAGMFRSNETPAFAEMVSNLFSQSNQNQKAGLLQQLLAAVPPGSLAALPGLGSLVGTSDSSVSNSDLLATQLSQEQVRQIAEHAEAHDPSIIDRVGHFYAQHPGVMKAVGEMAIGVVLQQMTKRRR
jgi:hypothetical protein